MNTAFSQILERNRAAFNAQFAQARQSAPSLDGDEFVAHLRETVAPIVERCDAIKPERTAEIVETLYEISLQLTSKGLLGARSRNALVARAWTELLPAIAKIVVLAPRQIVGSVSNALWQLSQTRGANGERWLAMMRQIADLCSDAPTFLAAGRVAAWRCGLATSRDAAIQTGRELPPEIARAIFNLTPTTSASQIAAIWTQLQNDVWYAPLETLEKIAHPESESSTENAASFETSNEETLIAQGENANAPQISNDGKNRNQVQSTRGIIDENTSQTSNEIVNISRFTDDSAANAQAANENANAANLDCADANNAELNSATSSTRMLRLVARVGDFGGFGGEFSSPPLVALVDGEVHVFENGQSWRLFADAFGATTVRVRNEKVPIDHVPVEPWKRVLEVFPEAKNLTSLAFDGRTVALTLPTSHRVWLFA